jgi:hypothetical protein
MTTRIKIIALAVFGALLGNLRRRNLTTGNTGSTGKKKPVKFLVLPAFPVVEREQL